jgi:serine/threonine protein kinase
LSRAEGLPGNIMVTASGEPVLLDFRLVHDAVSHVWSLTRTGDLIGTPAYMSPEQVQARGQAVDRRTDVFSLGVTLYECLTLKLPFDAPAVPGIYQKVLAEEPADPRRRNPFVRKKGVVQKEQEPSGAAQRLARQVPHDAEEPLAEELGVAQPRESTEGLQERLLDQVVEARRRHAERPADGSSLPLVADGELLEGIGIACETPPDEAGLRGGEEARHADD